MLKIGDVSRIRDADEVAVEFYDYNFLPGGVRRSESFVFLPGLYGFNKSESGVGQCGELVRVKNVKSFYDDRYMMDVCYYEVVRESHPFSPPFYMSEFMLEDVGSRFSEEEFISLLQE